jgi:hypothetical protein
MVCYHLSWISEAPNGPSRRSGDVGNRGSEGGRRERLRDPGVSSRPTGEECVRLSIEEDDDGDWMLAVANGAGYGHAPHGSDLEIDDRRVDGLVSGCGGSGGRIIVVDQFVRSDTQSGVNLVPHPWFIGNDQKA